MKRKLTYLFLLVVCLVVTIQVLVSCARIGTPDGGLYDETPPKLVKTTPEYGAVNNRERKISLKFNEYIKLEKAVESVIVSPPQMEQPEINSSGKKVTIELQDTLKPNFTYTIDFGNSIVDNNEGNPMGEYAFTFSTGDVIDTLQVSGTVLNAENLEPIKGILVGLYKIDDSDSTLNMEPDSLHLTPGFPDSTFTTRPLERIGRTDGEGHFIVKGVAEGSYRVFALNDQDQDYQYSQKSEMIAFSDRIIKPYVRPDVRQDTIWHDSIHYIRIDTVYYSHFFPDDIVLRAFVTKANADRYLIKSERPTLETFKLFFSAKSDTLPNITGLNCNLEDSVLLVESSQYNDSITYWIKDSLTFNLDTISIQLEYYATDTTGILVNRTDTLELISKVSKEKRDKEKKAREEEWEDQYREKIKAQRKAQEKEDEIKAREAAEAEGRKYEKKKKDKKKKKEEEENIVVPPMPDPLLDIKITPSGSLAPDENLTIEITEPIELIDTSKIHFTIKKDTLFVPARNIIRKIEGTNNKYRLYAEWEPDSTYKLEMDTGAIVNIYGKLSDAVSKTIKVKGLDSFSTLFILMHNVDTTAIIELLTNQEKVKRSMRVNNNKANFYFLPPQTYYMRMFFDRNGNGVWDPGDYNQHEQPEELYYYPSSLKLKAQWEFNQEWNPKATPLTKQKPKAITKQKPDKAKQTKHRNAVKLLERERKKAKKQQ